jgi:hypothetical protein
MRFLIACLILFAPFPGLAGTPPGSDDLGRFLPSETAAWKAAGEDRTFTRDTISGYLDGGAEAYLAYGFRRLLVREYSGPSGASLVAEVYDMGGAADAYGISANNRDGAEAAIGRDGRYGGGLLRFWKGPCFVRLLAEPETGATRGLLEEMGRTIAAAIPEDGRRPRIMDCLPVERLDRKSLRYFHKQVSLNSHYYLADENVLMLDEGTEAGLATYTEGWEKAMLLVCRYRSAADARRAYLRFGRAYFSSKVDSRGGPVVEKIETGKYAGARQADAFLILVFESPDRARCTALLRATESKIREVFATANRTPGGQR